MSLPRALVRLVGSAITVLSAFAAVVGWLAPGPASCAMPDAPARTIVANEPDMPESAVRAGAFGRVDVLVTLDERSQLIATRIVKSASPLLNESALAAARASTFSTRMHNCRYVPGSYIFVVDYRRNDVAD